jgi:tryptophan 2,3-dioxygenase
MSITGQYDPAQEGAVMTFDGRMAYGDYLRLDKILDAQSPLSASPDELLFIVQHQTSELWMKLAIHEIRSAMSAIREDRLAHALKMLARVARIFAQLNAAWDVLRTMTPSEYTGFREQLAQSSGFQSAQYRAIEFLVGNRNTAMLGPHTHRPEILQDLQGIAERPSLYDEAIALLRRQGFKIEPDRSDLATPRQLSEDVVETWRVVYTDSERYWPLYELAEKLVDFEDYFRRWRFNHVTTVERIIGLKRGTGGTGGVSYLRRMLEVELFPELWKVRTVL